MNCDFTWMKMYLLLSPNNLFSMELTRFPLVILGNWAMMTRITSDEPTEWDESCAPMIKIFCAWLLKNSTTQVSYLLNSSRFLSVVGCVLCAHYIPRWRQKLLVTR